MSSDFSPELRRELLDDFYAECDELLTALRAGLAQLDGAVGKGGVDAKTIEALFRGTHSLKGISAIVGLRPAEELAHGMEDLFRALSKPGAALDEAMIDCLLAATQRLEKIVTAHRLGKALPEISELLEQLHRPLTNLAKVTDLPPATAALPAEAIRVDPAVSARERGLMIFRATFAPSPALDQRGVNVTGVRQRLGALGEILSATPTVRGKGSIVFDFVLGLREAPAHVESWEKDGVKFAPLTEAAPVRPAPKSPLADDADFSETLSLTPSHIVRVDLARLDDLMRITGEMVIHRSRLEDRLQQGAATQSDLKEINLALSRSLREMREAITRVRMVPIAEVFTRMPFVVRDLMRGSEKKARVVLEGNQTEVDKYLVERLKEPLLHLVRNAFAHAVEPRAARVAAGKPAEATITLRAKSVGESIVIQVRDDGRGIDAGAVVARAAALGLSVPAQVDAAGVLKILCAPGFSTREEADLASGRGVGMAVVANTVRELGGFLTVETTLGAGSEFTLKLPLTLSIAQAIIVTVESETCAVPQSAVDEVLQISAGEVRTINSAEVIPYRGGLLPLVRLRAMFGAASSASPTLTILVVSSARGSTGLVVDRVRAQREIVIRPLADPLLRVPGISGATELGDGRPILILDPNVITQGVVRPANSGDSPNSILSEARAP